MGALEWLLVSDLEPPWHRPSVHARPTRLAESARAAIRSMHVLPRPNDKADGCAMLVRADVGEVEFEGYTFDDWGSRVCQVARLQLSGGRPLVLMQTHLTFPHRSTRHLRHRRSAPRSPRLRVGAQVGARPADAMRAGA